MRFHDSRQALYSKGSIIVALQTIAFPLIDSLSKRTRAVALPPNQAIHISISQGSHTMSHEPIFEVKLQVHESNERDYRVFITSLRARLRNHTTEHVQVLPPREGNTPRLFDIVLTANSGDVRLRIQQDDLYIIGYQAHNTIQNSATWYEIENAGRTHLIEGATWLGFDAGYTRLQDISGRRREKMHRTRWCSMMPSTNYYRKQERQIFRHRQIRYSSSHR